MQKELTFKKYSYEEAKDAGIPVFNDCNHYLVDLSHLKPSADYMNTIVAKLPYGNFVTICVMQNSKDETSLDVSFEGDNLIDHRVEPMGDNVNGLSVNPEYPNINRGIYALIAHSNVRRDEL